MTLTVSSAFLAESRRGVAEPRRHFTIGGSDYGPLVTRWPTLRYRAGTIDLGTTALTLSNARRALQFLVDCDVALTTSCELALGFAPPGGVEARVSLYTGTPAHVRFEDGGTHVRLHLQGKTRRLTDTVLGTDAASGALDFTGSAAHPADLAWTLVTCHGGLSDVESDSNPDLDPAEWQAWRDADEIRGVRVKAWLTGEKLYQVLDTLALMDARAIGFRDNRLRVGDAVPAFGAAPPALDVERCTALELSMDPAAIVNHFFAEAGYDPATGTFAGAHSRVSSRSVADFGRKSARFSSRGVWFADVGDARFLADERVYFGRRPAPRLSVRGPLALGVHHAVGDVVTVTDSGLGLQARPFRVVEQALALDTGELSLELAAARHRPWQFEASVASANLAVRTLTAADSGTLLALDDDADAPRLYRTDSAGTFAAMDAHATALAVLADGTVLLGGPPAAGATAVLQRSSDGGSSSVVVASLAPGTQAVHAIHPAGAATCVAAADSGQVLRSTDAGSSWAVTAVISPAYHLRCFAAPTVGVLWGATGYEDPAAAAGLHLWESVDDGATWAPRHTFQTSGDYRAVGLHILSGSAFLLAYEGATTAELGMLRGTRGAGGAVSAWAPVLAGAALAALVETGCGHLLGGYERTQAVEGGTTFRSLDAGSSWQEDARVAKQGNVALRPRGDGTVQAWVARSVAAPRTDRYRNYDPDEVL